MPRYDYRCSLCGHTEEREMSFVDIPDVLDNCPDCNYGNLKRVYSPVAVSFKGSGFYKTDNPKTKHVKTSAKVGGQ